MLSDQPPAPPPEPAQARNGRSLAGFVMVVGSVIVLFILYVGLTSTGDNGASTPTAAPASSRAEPNRLVNPAAFEQALQNTTGVLINVHVPYAGEIPGTDLFIPFDTLRPDDLPTDRSTELLVYCRSGTMSASAVVTLDAFGYTNVVELDGGMNAWEASGRTLLRAPSGTIG